MAEQLGSQSYMGVAEETVWNDGTAPTVYYPVKSMTPGDIQEFGERKDELRASRFPKSPVVGGNRSEPTFKMNVYPNMLGLFLRGHFGDASDAVVEAGVWDNTFEPGLTVDNSLSLEMQPGGANPRNIAGFMVNKLEFSVDAGAGNILELTVSGGGTISTEGTTDAVTYVETIPFRWFSATITKGGATIYPDNFKLSLDNGLKLDNWKLSGGQGIVKPVIDTGIYVPTGEMQVNFEDYTHFDDFLAGTEFEVVVTFLSTETIGAASKYTLTMTMPNCRFIKSDIKVDNPSLLKEPLAFECLPGTVGGSTVPISIVLRTDEDLS